MQHRIGWHRKALIKHFHQLQPVLWYVEEHESSTMKITLLDLGPSNKKMVQSFGGACTTAQVEGVCMGCGSRQKYRAKWTDLSEELISEFSSNHWLLQDPSKDLPPKDPKFHGPQSFSRHEEGSSSAVSNMADAVKLYPSSAEDSEPEDVEPQIPAISPLRICDNDLRMDPT